MLPKDYIAYRLSGVHCTDYSDASGMLLLDVKNRKWSDEMIQICGIRREMLPDLYESYEAVGAILPEVAEQLGFSGQVKIVAGAGDNAAAAWHRNCWRRKMQYFAGNQRHDFYIQQKIRGGRAQWPALL